MNKDSHKPGKIICFLPENVRHDLNDCDCSSNEPDPFPIDTFFVLICWGIVALLILGSLL